MSGDYDVAVVGGGLLGSAIAWGLGRLGKKVAVLDEGDITKRASRANFALGIERPWYLSVHSATARLAPAGAALIHVLRYFSAGESHEPKAVRNELEGVLDLVQPGWRDVLVQRRELPMMCVAGAVARADQNGIGFDRTKTGIPDAMGSSVRTALGRYTEWRAWKTGKLLGA